MKKRRWIILVGLLVFCFLISRLSSSSPAEPTPNPQPTQVLSSPIPSLLPLPSPTSAPSPTSIFSFGAFPNLMAADVKVNLEERGFSCSPPQQGQIGFSHICTWTAMGIEFQVDIYGDKPLSVGLIELNAVSQTGAPLPVDTIKPVFGFVATIPYVGLNSPEQFQAQARKWVEQTLQAVVREEKGTTKTTQIGPVYFKLLDPGTGLAYTLEISARAP